MDQIENTQMPANPLAYEIAMIDLGDAEERRNEAFEALAAAIKKTETARSGFHTIDDRKKNLAARVSALRSDISAADGSIAAAAAMGLTSTPSPKLTNIKAMRGEIDAAEDEIGKLESAKASAPGLFQPLIDDLLTKMATARAAYAECFAIIDVWAAKALDQASAIRAEAEYVRAALSLNPAILGGAVPALRALSTDNVNALLSDRARLERAKRETAPLVPPPPTVINAHDEAEAFERRHAELTAQNRAAAESWHKEREAEEERKRMENNRAALAKHESLVIKIDRAG